MIAFVQGTVDTITDHSVVVNVSGIGYDVFVPSSILPHIRVGGNTKLYTYHYVREDDMRLFGFLTMRDLELFKLLITVNGVGPKAGLAILSVYDADSVIGAVEEGDERLFASVSGIGEKGAAKIVIELRGKLLSFARAPASKQEKLLDTSARNDLVDALVGLGYSEREIYGHMKAIDQSKSLNAQIKQALGLLGK